MGAEWQSVYPLLTMWSLADWELWPLPIPSTTRSEGPLARGKDPNSHSKYTFYWMHFAFAPPSSQRNCKENLPDLVCSPFINSPMVCLYVPIFFLSEHARVSVKWALLLGVHACAYARVQWIAFTLFLLHSVQRRTVHAPGYGSHPQRCSLATTSLPHFSVPGQELPPTSRCDCNTTINPKFHKFLNPPFFSSFSGLSLDFMPSTVILWVNHVA